MAYIPQIVVEPKNSLVINPVRIFGNNFKPESTVTIVASVFSKPENISFNSFAHIIISCDGSFDLSKTESLGGTYTGVHQMGLFWSMINEPNSFNRLQCADPSIPLEYEFKVYNSHVNTFVDKNLVCTTNATRHMLTKDVSRKFIKYGRIRGILFCPPGNGPFPAVITLYGGTKKQLPIQDVSAILVNNGYVSLALAYFNVDDLPKVYGNLDIEYFEEAVVFLQNLPVVNKSSIGVYGISKGGSVALAMASFLPQIKSVVSMNGSLHSIGGYTKYNGVTIPKLVYKDETYFKVSKYDTIVGSFLHANIPLNDPSLIPFERSKSHILFVVSLDDSSVNVEHYLKILNIKISSAKTNNLKVITCDGMGHLVDAPYMPVCVCAPSVEYPEIFVEYGGRNIQAHALAQINVWKYVIDFFDSSLKIPLSSL
ncbi:acyl-coenzyme A thioesterase 3-like [Hydra vulgaris]|uniref:Acyl-coenzyme A thioesterase 3-like n=1 Tax=Hydra vulgaris TaxID=6087 RepID=A0ABM4DA86_HYDVU